MRNHPAPPPPPAGNPFVAILVIGLAFIGFMVWAGGARGAALSGVVVNASARPVNAFALGRPPDSIPQNVGLQLTIEHRTG